MRTLVTVTALAILLAGCGDPHQAKREALRNEVIAFRVVAESNMTRPNAALPAIQRLETAISIADADGVTFDPAVRLELDKLATLALKAKMNPSPDAISALYGQAWTVQIAMGEAH